MRLPFRHIGAEEEKTLRATARATAVLTGASQQPVMSTKNSHLHGARFEAVLDSRKRKIPGLWRRGARFYAQLRVTLANGKNAPRRLALDATTLDQAKSELGIKRADRDRGKLPVPTGRPQMFAEFAATYLASGELAQKKTSTQTSERQAIARWIKHLGNVRLDRVGAVQVHGYREARLSSGTSPRTVNLDVIALRHVLRFAVDAGLIVDLPKVRALKQRPAPRRPLLSKEQFAALLSAANPKTTKNFEQLRFYLRFLALTGAREKESLGVRRVDVDLMRGGVTIRCGRHLEKQPRADGGFLARAGGTLAGIALFTAA